MNSSIERNKNDEQTKAEFIQIYEPIERYERQHAYHILNKEHELCQYDDDDIKRRSEIRKNPIKL